jgi:polar amino acid transport system substrate-binding protein
MSTATESVNYCLPRGSSSSCHIDHTVHVDCARKRMVCRMRWHGRLHTLAILLGILAVGGSLAGCGLLMDAAQWVRPVPSPLSDDLAIICRHEQLHVGIASEPAPPFVVLLTEDPPEITGLDIELLQAITAAISRECGRPVKAVPTILPVRDLFIELTEGHVDLFLSAMATNLPHLIGTGIGYSAPYFSDTGIIALTRDPQVAARIRTTFQELLNAGHHAAEARRIAFRGLTVAVQEERTAHLLAAARLTDSRLLVCDTLAAAFTSAQSPDVVLGKQKVLEFLEQREPSVWQPLVLDHAKPLLLVHEQYAVVLAETKYHLRWLVNDLLWELEESGRLADMRRRWLTPSYPDSAEALKIAVPCSECKESRVKSPGSCRITHTPTTK